MEGITVNKKTGYIFAVDENGIYKISASGMVGHKGVFWAYFCCILIVDFSLNSFLLGSVKQLVEKGSLDGCIGVAVDGSDESI
jgi:hypothetical protein